jgi:hypothetical protein
VSKEEVLLIGVSELWRVVFLGVTLLVPRSVGIGISSTLQGSVARLNIYLK